MIKDTFQEKDKFQLIIEKIKKNYKILISIIGICLLILFVYLFIQNNIKKENINISEDFNQARILISQDKKNEGKNILFKIVEKKNKFYSPLSLFVIIDQKLEEDNQKITEMFDKVISIKGIDEENKDLIKIKKALFLTEFADEDIIIKTLNPIINSKSVWRSDAINLLGDFFTNRGENFKAKEYYDLLKIK
tara:strand:+ start:1976 stop:2551 length:576 start_codon:yes stop_codon:yes gene_type:complete